MSINGPFGNKCNGFEADVSIAKCTGCPKKKFTLGIQFDFSIFSAYFNDTPQTNTTFKKLTKF